MAYADGLTEEYPALIGAGAHGFCVGASESALRRCEATLGAPIPRPLRAFLALSNGAVLFDGAVRIAGSADLPDLNDRMRGGWFDEQQIFFAESKADDDFWRRRKLEVGPDYYFFDLANNPALEVKYFYFTPTEIGVAAQGFGEWIRRLSARGGVCVPESSS